MWEAATGRDSCGQQRHWQRRRGILWQKCCGGWTLAAPCLSLPCGCCPLSKPPRSPLPPAEPLPSRPGGPGHEPPPLQPQLPQSRAPSPLTRAGFPLQIKEAGSYSPVTAVWEWCEQLRREKAFLSVRLSPLLLSAGGTHYISFFLHLCALLLFSLWHSLAVTVLMGDVKLLFWHCPRPRGAFLGPRCPGPL